LEAEIFETPETLRSFILSPGSWLYASSQLSRDSYVKYYKFRSEMYCGLSDDNYDSIATVDYGGPDNKVDIEISLFDPFDDISFKCIIKGMCSDIGLDEVTGKLVVRPYYETMVELIGDTYNLITLEPKEDFNELDEKGVCGRNSMCGYQKYKDNLVSEFSLPGYAKSYKACQVIIQSQKYIGDTSI
jgi:hypothetical protein